jgi:hypothetical protein
MLYDEANDLQKKDRAAEATTAEQWGQPTV